MAQYAINFTSNTPQAIKDIDRLIGKISAVSRIGSRVVLDVDTSRFSSNINASFKQLDKQIAKFERRLSKLSIGSGGFERTAAALGTVEGRRQRGAMQAQAIRLTAQAEAFDAGSAAKLRRELEAASTSAQMVAPNTREWIDLQQRIAGINLELRKSDQLADAIQMRENLGAFAPGSLAQLETKLSILKNKAREISPSTSEWRALNREIIQTEQNIAKVTKRRASLGQRAGAAGGAFLYGGGLGGGIGSALGGIAGGFAGGVPGAFTGAALGQLADNLARYAAGIAATVADVNKARIALAGVTRDAQDYDKALAAVTASSQKFLLPIVDATQQFTKLQASVVGAGYDTTVTTQAFNAIGAAVIATGGSTEDLNSALRATSQVFSKGKVSAEELRQQIGERLPGAFTIFAQAIGQTPQQLDKLLQEGKVTLDDFIKFLGELDKRYGSTAELLAKAPENAGARLKVALQAATVAYGGFFQKVGAGFQAYLTDLVNFTLKNQEQVKRLVATFAVAAQDIYTIFSNLINTLAPLFTNFFKFIFTNFTRGVNALANLAEQSRAAAGGPEQRAAKAVEALYPNPIDRALYGAEAYKQALGVEIQYSKGIPGRRKTREARVDEMVNQMFTPFRPTQFGAGIGKGVPGGAGAAGGAGGAAKRGKGRESRLPELTEELNLARQLLALEQQISMAELGGNQLAVIRLNGIKEQLKIRSEIAKVALQVDTPAAEKQRQIEILRLEAEKERLQTNFQIQQQIQRELQSVQDAMVGIATTARQELEDRQTYEKLVKDGLAPVLAQITVEVRRQFATEVEKLKTLEKQVIAEIAILDAKENQTDNDKKQLKILRDRLALIQGGITEAPALAEEAIQSRTQKQLLEDQPQSAIGFLKEASDNAQKELAKLNNWGYQVAEGGKAIGSSFGQAFKDIVSGSKSAQEALANMMQSIADHFLDMAAQIIAQQITMMIYGMILKALGVMGGVAGGFSGNAAGFGGSFDAGIAPLPNVPDYSGAFKFANGGIAPGGFKAFANGGMVTGPTLGLMGEGKYNEAIVPLPDGRSIPVQLQDNSIRDKMEGNGAAGMSMPMLSMNFQSTTINGVEYVDRAQLEAAMAETRKIAVREGASRGATIALDKLANSPSSRRRVGLR